MILNASFTRSNPSCTPPAWSLIPTLIVGFMSRGRSRTSYHNISQAHLWITYYLHIYRKEFLPVIQIQDSLDCLKQRVCSWSLTSSKRIAEFLSYTYSFKCEQRKMRMKKFDFHEITCRMIKKTTKKKHFCSCAHKQKDRMVMENLLKGVVNVCRNLGSFCFGNVSWKKREFTNKWYTNIGSTCRLFSS